MPTRGANGSDYHHSRWISRDHATRPYKTQDTHNESINSRGAQTQSNPTSRAVRRLKVDGVIGRVIP